VVSKMNESSFIWFMYTYIHTYECLISYICFMCYIMEYCLGWMSHQSYHLHIHIFMYIMNLSESGLRNEWVMSRIQSTPQSKSVYESCDMCKRIKSHIWMGAPLSHGWVISHTWMSPITYMNAMCQEYDGAITSHIRMSLVT